jgi:hypothetical protein
MYTLIVFFAAIFAISFLNAPTMGAGWGWDADNALGFAALASMLYLSAPGGARRDVRAHEWLGYTVLGITLVHALWFLLVDGAAVEYIKPGAPAYMWTGILGALSLFVLIVLAKMPTRQKAHRSHAAFRRSHQLVAIAGILCAIHHIIASGFYLRSWYQVILLAAFAAIAMFGRGIWGRLRQTRRVTPGNLLVISFLGAAVFTVVRNWHP